VNEFEQDEAIRLAAFEHIGRLRDTHAYLSGADLNEGFVFQGERIPFVNRQRGIFKPRQLKYLLSIRTVFPRQRRYALRMVKQRLHQASFREAVIDAYDGRCALSELPEPLLIDAAYIVRDSDELLGQPVVQNGIPLSKIHHVAFDAHLIGIDPDYRVHISERLLIRNDGPLLATLKNLDGGKLRMPLRPRDNPDRDRLAARFEQFKNFH